jgi:hypothetical protein
MRLKIELGGGTRTTSVGGVDDMVVNRSCLLSPSGGVGDDEVCFDRVVQGRSGWWSV